MLISNSTREYYHINCKLAVYKSKSQAVLLLYMSESHPSTHLVFPLNEFYNKVKMIVEYTNSLVNSIFVSGEKIMLIIFRVKQVKRNQLIKHEAKFVLVKEFMCHRVVSSTF